MALDKQIQILSVDTGDFYYPDEADLHELNRLKRNERKELIEGFVHKDEDGNKIRIIGIKTILEKLNKLGYTDEHIKSLKGDIPSNASNEIKDLLYDYFEKSNKISQLGREAGEIKKELLELLKERVRLNEETNGKDHIRELNKLNTIVNKNGEYKNDKIISIFDSSVTRTIGAKPDNLTEDIMVVQVYYFDVIKDLICNGFIYKGEKYIYYTSSAGQIRTKKTVFIKESVWNKYEKTLMCGLTINKINEKGGMNVNKFLAYLALSNSATDVWKNFDIDKCIVIDDFETNVYGTFDLINDKDYSIKRISDYVPVPHTDGSGMMLPCLGNNRMVRVPWIKGLLGVFDFVKFINKHNCSPIIKDIYGKEYDIIKENIQIIFTKSQFKLWKFYDSWDQYKEYYKKYNCTAGYTNLEEDRIKDATINYQMLQTLTDITDAEIEEIAKASNERIKHLSDSVQHIKEALGINTYNKNQTNLQQAINLYPNLINDNYTKIVLKETKDSMLKRYRAGALKIRCKYTFVLPDFYAACEYWFLGEENPKGLLDDKEVFCSLFKTSEELDCLRSPHLYKEHAIRKNIACNKYDLRQREIREWFSTNAIYTSCRDLISKILQFDVDGDKLLVVSDKIIIDVAKKNMIGIVPLYYNMSKALPCMLNNESVYNGLKAAFTGSNIGQYSNNISKIWNSDIFINGTEEEKQKAVDIVKLLCCENNFVIDYAKTLYKPTRPKEKQKEIVEFTKEKLPHFFVYAKDKENNQVRKANDTLVNKLQYIIKDTRLSFKSLVGKVDYTMLMSNHNKIKIDKKLIEKYDELNTKYHWKINMKTNETPKSTLTNSKARQQLFLHQISIEIKKELSSFGYTDEVITDMLVKHLFHDKKSKHKNILWFCYGDLIVNNLRNNGCELTERIAECEDCGKMVVVDIFNGNEIRCPECAKIQKRELKRLKMQRYRSKNKM